MIVSAWVAGIYLDRALQQLKRLPRIATLLGDETQVMKRGWLIRILGEDLTIHRRRKAKVAPLVARKCGLQLLLDFLKGWFLRAGHDRAR